MSAAGIALAPLTVERHAEFTRETARHACARCHGLILAEVRAGDLCGGCGAELEVTRARPGSVRHQEPRPEWLETLELYGGRNLYGGLNVRLVWSNSRSFLSGGEWFERSLPIFGEASEPGKPAPLLGFHWLEEFELAKYDIDKTTYRFVNKQKRVRVHDEIEDRWVFEVWRPQSYYGTPEEWDATHLDPFTGLLVIHDYPERGEYDYEPYWICQEKGTGAYLTPTREIIRWVCRLVRAGKENKDRVQLKASWRKERDAEKAARQEKADNDYVDANYRSPRLVPFVGYGQKSAGRKAHLL